MIPEDEFREVNEWCNENVLEWVMFEGNIEAGVLVLKLCGSEGPVGWPKLGADRRARAVWRAVDRLCDRRLIERYHSKDPRHNRSRVRLRVVSVLDRIVHAVEKSEE